MRHPWGRDSGKRPELAAHALLFSGMGWWIVGGLLMGAVAAGLAAYFQPEQETTIERGVLAEEIRRSIDELGPLMHDLDLKDLKNLKK